VTGDLPASTGDDARPAAPVLRVVKGDPRPDEVAALVAVVLSRSGGAEPTSSGRVSVWASRARLVRPPLRPGGAAWRTSGWPR
jgi:hypothetical protein